MLTPFLHDQLFFHRQNLPKSQLDKEVKVYVPKYPYNIEREYAKQIKRWMQTFTVPTKEFILANFTRWKQSLKIDSFYSEEDEYIEALEAQQQKLFDEEKDQRFLYLLGVAGAVSLFNTKELRKMFSSVGISVYSPAEPWLQDVLNNWANTNLTLIKSLSQEYIKKVNALISKGVLTDMPLAEMTKEITKLNIQMIGGRRKLKNGQFKKIQGRSELIAKDQVGSLNGELTKRRHQEAGINTYNWHTALDELVRGNPGGKYPSAVPSHYAMQGLLLDWDNSSIYSGDNGATWLPKTGSMEHAIPGGAIGCRCTSSANFSGFIIEIDKQIKE